MITSQGKRLSFLVILCKYSLKQKIFFPSELHNISNLGQLGFPKRFKSLFSIICIIIVNITTMIKIIQDAIKRGEANSKSLLNLRTSPLSKLWSNLLCPLQLIYRPFDWLQLMTIYVSLPFLLFAATNRIY